MRCTSRSHNLISFIKLLFSLLISLKSSYSVGLPAYEQFKAELAQQKLDCEQALKTLVEEYQQLNNPNSSPGKILSFTREEDQGDNRAA